MKNFYYREIWDRNKQWLMDFDGSACEFFFPNVSFQNLSSGLLEMMRKFRAGSLKSVDLDDAQISIPQCIEYLGLNKINNCVLDYVFTNGFDLNIRLIIDRSMDRYDLEAIWWKEEVFKTEQKNENFFFVVIEHFVSLGRLFNCPAIYLSPETTVTPKQSSSDWFKINVEM